MDNGLVRFGTSPSINGSSCLNPYCSGQWSRTPGDVMRGIAASSVLILIVVDNGLVLFGEKNGNGGG